MRRIDYKILDTYKQDFQIFQIDHLDKKSYFYALYFKDTLISLIFKEPSKIADFKVGIPSILLTYLYLYFNLFNQFNLFY